MVGAVRKRSLTSMNAIHGCRRTLAHITRCTGRRHVSNKLENLAPARTVLCLRRHKRRIKRGTLSVRHRTMRYVVRRIANCLRGTAALPIVGSRGTRTLGSQTCAPSRTGLMSRRRDRGCDVTARLTRTYKLETRRLLALHPERRHLPSSHPALRDG